MIHFFIGLYNFNFLIGNVPVVYCLKNQLANKNDKRVVVKTHDPDGYFYATETTPIDCWQLFESTEAPPIIYESSIQSQQLPNINIANAKNNMMNKINSINKSKSTSNNNDKMLVLKTDNEDTNEDILKNKLEPLTIDPYEQTDNLVKVEKRVDPKTGQTIFIRWIRDDPKSTSEYDLENNYDLPELLYSDGTLKKHEKNTPIIIREDTRTPSPIIVEKYITKKSPQIIIKEIHVNEPAPPPYKVVQNIDGSLPYQYSQQQNHQQQQQQQQQRMPPPSQRQTSPYNNILNSSTPDSPNRNNKQNGSLNNLNSSNNFGTLMRRNPNMPPPLTPTQTPPPPAYNPQTGNRIVYNSFKAPTKPIGRYTPPPMNSLPPQLEYKSNKNNNNNNNNSNNNSNKNQNYSNFYSMNTQNYGTIRNQRPSHAHSMNRIYTPPPTLQDENSMIPKNSNFYSMQPSISSEIKKYVRHTFAHPQDFDSPMEIRNKKYGYAARNNSNSRDNINDITIQNKPSRNSSIIHNRTAIIDRVVENTSNNNLVDFNRRSYYTDTIKSDKHHLTDSLRRHNSKHDHHHHHHHHSHHHHNNHLPPAIHYPLQQPVHHSSQRNINDTISYEQSRMLPHRININQFKQDADKFINSYRR